MIGAVVFKDGTALSRGLEPLLSSLSVENVRFLGKVYVYEFHRGSVFFVPLKQDFSFWGRQVERMITEGVGRPRVIVSLRPGESFRLYPTGNITNTNPLLHPSFSPRTISPVNPDVLGTLWLSLTKMGKQPSIAAVHDPPSDLSVPHIAMEIPPRGEEDAVLTILASLRHPRVHVPYVTVSTSYLADYFAPLLRKRIVPAYHVPFYWSHFLDGEMFEQMKRKGGVRKVLVQKGLVLPGELPQKEV